MQALLSRQQARAIDRAIVAATGMPTLLLMENAARSAGMAIEQHHAAALARGVVVVAGVGQNGGDGVALARQLRAQGVQVLLILVGNPADVRGDAAQNWAIWQRLPGVQTAEWQSARAAELQSHLTQTGLIIDAVFGTGLNRPVTGETAEAILAINAAPVPTVALDVPSGIDADTGAVLGVAVEATLTVTFAAAKRGLFQWPGRGHAGRIVLGSLGAPWHCQTRVHWVTPADLWQWLPAPAADQHKGRAGHVDLVTGAPGTAGAALLSARASLRAGAGLVRLWTHAALSTQLQGLLPELMCDALAGDSATALQQLTPARPAGTRHRSALLGPGFGRDTVAMTLLRALARQLVVPTVLDADALHAVGATGLATLRTAAAPRLLTPHPGEAAMLLDTTVAGVQADRYQAATELATRSGQVVVLKGAGSIIADPQGNMVVSDWALPLLGVGGSGDVLAGLCAQQLLHLPPFEAAIVAVELHARAAQRAARLDDGMAPIDSGLLASEIADALPAARASLVKGAQMSDTSGRVGSFSTDGRRLDA
ncbi:MAG: NAD(P)H-hydrate dehydratase [Polyangiales bacterium]